MMINNNNANIVVDDYLDYSCSTSLERLARDVETRLRDWHLVDADRHVSMVGISNNSSCLLQRATLTYESASSSEIQLLLCLWDETVAKKQPSGECSWEHLPYSLHPLAEYATITSDPNNVSVLFGIGQYVTLTLETNPTSRDDSVASNLQHFYAGASSQHARSKVLQTALNIAAMNCQCYLPCFGTWTTLDNMTTTTNKNNNQQLDSTSKATNRTKSKQKRNCNLPILHGTVLGHADCALYELEYDSDKHLLDVAANLLRPCSKQQKIALVAAQHAYKWHKSKTNGIPWRILEDDEDQQQTTQYDDTKRALSLLEQAAAEKPLWGPPDDPLESMVITVAQRTINKEPLLLKHSNNDWSQLDTSTYFRTSHVTIQVRIDHDSLQASLGATQTCVLAALIRTATLPLANNNNNTATTCAHVLDPVGWDAEAGTVVALQLASHATTKALVAAMDWTSPTMEQWQAQEVVQSVMKESSSWSSSSLAATETEQTRSEYCLPNSAPPGRLLSLLFTHMARVRSPANMALIWLTFVQELRWKWANRERLPIMQGARGLDPACSTLKQCDSREGTGRPRIDLADPDGLHCLIGQKLLVFNVCLESLASNHHESPVCKRQRQNVAEDALGQHADISDEEFYDTNDGEEIVTNTQGNNDASVTSSSSFDEARQGVRCPLRLLANGEPLSIPHLQTAYPLTDDVIAERTIILGQQNHDQAETGASQRLDVAHRWQRPKLLSDIKAFKAANPDSLFEDFIAWYGVPEDPLQAYDAHDTEDAQSNPATEQNGALTRQFWWELWNQADPVAAVHQPPLFDASTTIEMMLDDFESLHPANLLCQVMAVNLRGAFFALSASAGTAARVVCVAQSLQQLQSVVRTALRRLFLNVIAAVNPQATHNDSATVIPTSVASLETIACSERACCALRETECVLARAVSLLHKFPDQYDLVHQLLSRPHENACIRVESESSRQAVLKAISCEAQIAAAPLQVQEYVVRGTDDAAPCHLTLRYERSDDDNDNSMGTLRIALTRTSLSD
jgi:hypothetical protein